MSDPATTPGRHAWIVAVAQCGFALCAAWLGYWLATHYVPRLSDHRGFFLVGVADAVGREPAERPRQTLVVIVDGLRRDAAEGMSSVAALRARGRCLAMDVGLPSVSRPVYAMLSTGLEQDRTGARNNDETSALAAESVWQVFREAGLRVDVRSELPWWPQLFPRGFDGSVVIAGERSSFPPQLSADVTLIHPVYVDETAHRSGAASELYRSAVARVDGELAPLLATMNLDVDLVAFTADHGHRDRGGHGGPSPEVRTVLTCFAGRGVAPSSTVEPLDGRAFAPTLAALVGTRFPRHMRAGEDGLDVIGRIVSSTMGDAYLRDRREAVERYRAANQVALSRMAGAASWSELTRAGQRAQLGYAVGCAMIGAAALAVYARLRRWSARHATSQLAACVVVTAVFVAAYAALAGGVDATSLNTRAEFVKHTLLASAIALLSCGALHLVALRRIDRTHEVSLLLVGLGVLVNAAHIVVFDWPLGHPVPPPVLYFMPFLSSTWLVSCGVFAAALTAARFVRARDA